MSKRSQRFWWLVSVIVAFILGWWLARRMCGKEVLSSGLGNGAVVVSGSSAAGPQSHIKLGTGNGTADGGGGSSNGIQGGVDSASGGGGRGSGGDDEAGGGGGSGTVRPGAGTFTKLPKLDDKNFGNYVGGLLRDQPDSRVRTRDSVVSDPRIVRRVAHDFSLDATGIPRYPNGVSKVLSGVATRPDIPIDTGTAAGIETDDSFDAVVAWYRKNLSPGWRELVIPNVGDLATLANKLTPEKIMKMLVPPAGGDTTLPDTAAMTAGTSGGGAAIAMWSATDNDNHHRRSLMVSAQPGKPTAIMMSREVRE